MQYIKVIKKTTEKRYSLGLLQIWLQKERL